MATKKKGSKVRVGRMVVLLGAGLVKLLEDTFWDQQQLGGSAWVRGRGEQVAWAEGQEGRAGE